MPYTADLNQRGIGEACEPAADAVNQLLTLMADTPTDRPVTLRIGRVL